MSGWGAADPTRRVRSSESRCVFVSVIDSESAEGVVIRHGASNHHAIEGRKLRIEAILSATYIPTCVRILQLDTRTGVDTYIIRTHCGGAGPRMPGSVAQIRVNVQPLAQRKGLVGEDVARIASKLESSRACQGWSSPPQGPARQANRNLP